MRKQGVEREKKGKKYVTQIDKKKKQRGAKNWTKVGGIIE